MHLPSLHPPLKLRSGPFLNRLDWFPWLGGAGTEGTDDSADDGAFVAGSAEPVDDADDVAGDAGFGSVMGEMVFWDGEILD